MPRVTPVYRLPYLQKGDVLSGLVERTRFEAIDRQLEALFTFLGDGIISGWQLSVDGEKNNRIAVSRGSGVIASIAAATTAVIRIDEFVTEKKNFVYAHLLGTTPYTAQAEFLASPAQFDTNDYLCLGAVNVAADGTISSITDECRTELSLISQITGIIAEHVHTGEPGEPEKIDLFNHVKGVLSAANIEDLPASKITGGVFDRNRFQISHNDLEDIGTLTHEELDSLVEQLQKINKILFGDIMTANQIQLLLSFKHVWEDFDDYMINFASVIPGLGNNQITRSDSFIDVNATTAEVDYLNHRIKGRFIEANELGQFTINTRSEFETGTYDSSYVAILDTSIGYGYGWGYGSGLDYFDVFEVDSGTFFEGSTAKIAFPGSTIGYGYGDFETTFAGMYGYGYGYEYASGFPNTLTSTIVTLQALSANLSIHDKDSDTYNDTLGSSSLFDPSPVTSGTTDLLDFLIQSSNNASLNSRRSTTLNTSNSQSSDLYAFVSGKQTIDVSDNSIKNESDISAVYTVWTEPYDMTIDNYLYFVLKQQANNGSTNYFTDFDDDWTFDHSMNLIVEATSTDSTKRYFYRYQGIGGGSSFRFFDKDTKYFSTDILETPVNDFRPATALVSAKIVDDSLSDGNLEFLGGYEVQATAIDEDSTVTEITTAPSFATVRENITGFYLVAINDANDNYERFQEFGPIYFPQGKLEQMADQSALTDAQVDARMPADIDSVYISGAFGYSTSVDRNKIEDLTITFPDPVDFESLTWVAEEPSNSVIYIQIKRDAVQSAGDAGDLNYRTNPIYTNSGAELNSRQISGFPYINPLDPDYDTDLANTYRVSSSNFPDAFKNTRKISLRVVLLPTSDGQIAPALNSITINYSSNTSSGQFTIATQDQWENVLSQENLKAESGQVSILDFDRVKNVIYGSEGKIVEYQAATTTWSSKVNTYTGGNLPRTVTQELNNTPQKISGYVTDVKVLENGDVAFLDRDSSRIVVVDMNNNIKKIIASEFAFDINRPDEFSTSSEATMVKAIYNREVGDNGVLYLVFSHELLAWSAGVNTAAGADQNVDPDRFNIRRAGLSTTLAGSDVIVCDRGILCFVLTSSIANIIESTDAPEIDTNFNATDSGTAGDNTSVKFKNDEVLVNTDSKIELDIQKFGEYTTPVTNDYSFLYAPIQGVVAFDMDENDNLYILKKTRPYSWDIGDDIDAEVWYGKMDMTTYWNGFSETSEHFNAGSVASEPNFFLSNVFGYKGSIQAQDDLLLITIPGFQQDGVLVFRKTSTTGETLYDLPTDITLTNDGTYPMAARFDPSTFVSGDVATYDAIYIALSDLRTGNSTSGGLSRVIRVSDDGDTVEWQWGSNASSIPAAIISEIGFAASVNDVRPLTFNDNEGVIIST